MSNRQVCKFYKQGKCNYGENCRFYHPGYNNNNSNNYGNNYNNNNNYNRDNSNGNGHQVENIKDFTSERSMSQKETQIKQDMQEVLDSLKNGALMFSSYSLKPPANVNLISGRDLSFEEARVKYYTAQATNTVPQHVQEVAARKQDMINISQQAKRDPRKCVRFLQLAVKNNGDIAKPFFQPLDLNSHNNGNNTLGVNNNTNSIFGTSSNNSAFGANPFSAGTSANPFNATSSSAFVSAPSAKSAFGTTQSAGAFGSQSVGAFGSQNTSAQSFGSQNISAGPFGSKALSNGAFGAQTGISNPFESQNSSTAFGKTGFTALGGPGVTTTPSLNTASSAASPFGPSSTTSVSPFGGSSSTSSAFGQGGFGSSGFGKSVFGQPGMTTIPSTSAFGGTAIATSTNSPFAANSAKPSPFGAATTNSYTAGNKSPFGSAASNSQTFGNAASNSTDSGAFGLTGFNQNVSSSTFGNTLGVNPFQQNGNITLNNTFQSATNSFASGFSGFKQAAVDDEPTKLDSLHETILNLFKNNSFTLGNVPDVPPPLELC